jgi:hypothetical protein
MSKPNKLKVIRKVSDTQLQVSINNVVTTNTISGTIGIGSTTSSSSTFDLIGKRNIKDVIPGAAAISSPSGVNGSAAGYSYGAEGNEHAHGSGGYATAGGNFFYSDITDVTGQWCMTVGSGSTNGKFTRCDEFMLSQSIFPYATSAVVLGDHSGVSGGTPQSTSAIPSGCSYASNSYQFTNQCYVAGCICSPAACANACPGALSGYQNSCFCTTNFLVRTELQTCSQSKCGGNWVHVKTPGRNENSL